jgi:hypothetical protein
MMQHLFEDETHRGWGLARILWALAMLATWLQRGVHFEERYTDVGAVLVRSYLPVNDIYYFSPTTGWFVYGLLLTSLVAVLRGRWTRFGLMVAMCCHISLCFTEGLNFKGYDRLMFWQALCLFVAPGRVDGKEPGLPLGRFCVVITYVSLYGQTGWEKIINEPTWWDGLPLMYNMVHRSFGDMPLGVFISDIKPLMLPLSWGTLFFEALFPFLYWSKGFRRWLLFLGLWFHLGILVFMNVPNFTFASLALYPLLLYPAEYDALVEQWKRLWQRQRPVAV